MPKYKPCNYDQMVMLPISLEAQLVPGSLEYTINEVVEKHVDLSAFDARYNNDETGATAIHPKTLLKIILLAYARGMLSSRQMERACLENVTFMALACGYAPDHSTIAAFVSSMQEEVKSVFCNVLLLCDQLGLLGGSHFSLDGVKRADPCDQREGSDRSISSGSRGGAIGRDDGMRFSWGTSG